MRATTSREVTIHSSFFNSVGSGFQKTDEAVSPQRSTLKTSSLAAHFTMPRVFLFTTRHFNQFGEVSVLIDNFVKQQNAERV